MQYKCKLLHYICILIYFLKLYVNGDEFNEKRNDIIKNDLKIGKVSFTADPGDNVSNPDQHVEIRNADKKSADIDSIMKKNDDNITIPIIENPISNNNIISGGIININDLIKEKPEFIIVTSSTKEYLPSAISWYNTLTNMNISNHYIIIPQNFPIQHIRKYKDIKFIKSNTYEKKASQKYSYRNILAWRVAIFTYLLSNQVSVLAADTDTIWVKNVIPLEFNYNYRMKYDVIFSYGTIFPDNIYRKWGFVICMGMVYLKSTYSTLKFMKYLESQCALNCDDQRISNEYLARKDHNMTWYTADDGAVEGIAYISSKSNALKNVNNNDVNDPHDDKSRIMVRVANEISVQRRFVSNLDLKHGYVFHPLLDKQNNKKMNAVRDVREAWNVMKSSASVDMDNVSHDGTIITHSKRDYQKLLRVKEYKGRPLYVSMPPNTSLPSRRHPWSPTSKHHVNNNGGDNEIPPIQPNPNAPYIQFKTIIPKKVAPGGNKSKMNPKSKPDKVKPKHRRSSFSIHDNLESVLSLRTGQGERVRRSKGSADDAGSSSSSSSNNNNNNNNTPNTRNSRFDHLMRSIRRKGNKRSDFRH